MLFQRIKVDEIIARARSRVNATMQREPSLVIAMTHKLLRNIAEHTDVEIAAHPDDITLIKGALSESDSVRTVTFSADESFSRASLIIKANKSIVDAHVHTQLERARTILVQRLESKYGNAH